MKKYETQWQKISIIILLYIIIYFTSNYNLKFQICSLAIIKKYKRQWQKISIILYPIIINSKVSNLFSGNYEKI